MTNADLIVALAAGLLSLGLAYIPGIKTKYEALSKEDKARVMGGLLIVVTVGLFMAACADLLALFGVAGISCDRQSAADLGRLLVVALMANQATFTLLVDPFNRKSPALPGNL